MIYSTHQLVSSFPLYLHNWCLREHSHPYHELVLVRRGRMRISWHHGQTEVLPGQIAVYPEGQAHASSATGILELMVLRWRGHLPGSAGLVSDSSGRIALQLEWLQELMPWEDCPDRDWALALLLSIIREYERQSVSSRSAFASRLRAFIRQHLADPVNLDGMALYMGLSRFHFIRRCKAECGLTPKALLRRLRVQEGRSLLLQTDLPMQQIAEQVGIPDVKYFTRCFGKEFGVAPRRLRQQEGKSYGP